MEEEAADRAPRGFRNLKFRPPQFSGKKTENVKQFISKFDKYCLHQGVGLENQGEALGLCLEQDALEAYDTMLRNDEGIGYDQLKERLIARFDDERINLVIRAKIGKRKLKAGESVVDFFNDLRKLADKISLEDQALLYAFISGLGPDMAEHIVCQSPDTANQAFQLAKTLEQVKSMGKQGEQRSTLETIKAELREAKVAAATTSNEEVRELRQEMRQEMAQLREAVANTMNENQSPVTIPAQQNWPRNGHWRDNSQNPQFQTRANNFPNGGSPNIDQGSFQRPRQQYRYRPQRDVFGFGREGFNNFGPQWSGVYSQRLGTNGNRPWNNNSNTNASANGNWRRNSPTCNWQDYSNVRNGNMYNIQQTHRVDGQQSMANDNNNNNNRLHNNDSGGVERTPVNASSSVSIQTGSAQIDQEDLVVDRREIDGVQASHDMIVKGFIDEMPVNILVDTGSTISIIGSKIVNRMIHRPPITPSSFDRIIAINKSETKISGLAEIPLRIGEFEATCQLNVLEDTNHDVLLGRDFLRKYAENVNVRKGTVELIGREGKICSTTAVPSEMI